MKTIIPVALKRRLRYVRTHADAGIIQYGEAWAPGALRRKSRWAYCSSYLQRSPLSI